MCNIKEETVSYYIKEAYNARRDYDNRIVNKTYEYFP